MNEPSVWIIEMRRKNDPDWLPTIFGASTSQNEAESVVRYHQKQEELGTKWRAAKYQRVDE